MGLKEEIIKRKTFAIVSHPDAGKTTLTEKLLLFGGAIQVAGAVKSNKIKKTTTSDFMEIEKQRGISVATSVMAFEYAGRMINILDTPGHKDFAEDTYRTLSAVDSAIVVIDAAKGVEEQTEKLVKVCRMRKIPIMVFINKLDREGLDGFDLLDDIEVKLGLTLTPVTWAIGMGQNFRGVYNLTSSAINIFNPHGMQSEENVISIKESETDKFIKHIGRINTDELMHDLNLIREVYDSFEPGDYLKGEICPVFFGSAINNFGVKELLDCFVEYAPNPLTRESEERIVDPVETDFSGFVFKIHANIDPNHRDRIAFLRVVSGVFKRNTNYLHTRIGKYLKFSSPTSFMAAKKNIIDEAFPGDIVGLYDSGNFKIGDSLTESEILNFKGIPSFSPEQFRYVINVNPMKRKQMDKGISQLMDEGLAQLFITMDTNNKIIGTVGNLQYEVIQYRLEHEYGASVRYEPLNIHKAYWIRAKDKNTLDEFIKRRRRDIAFDKDNRYVFLAETQWTAKTVMDNHPDIEFFEKSDF